MSDIDAAVGYDFDSVSIASVLVLLSNGELLSGTNRLLLDLHWLILLRRFLLHKRKEKLYNYTRK